MKLALILFGVAIALLALIEIGLRWRFGFGNPLLYVADPQTGYRLAPNQQVRRFGNRIQINQYSMRGPQMTVERPAATLRILLLGDSIANGGWWTDQTDILSEQISRQLQPHLAEFEAGNHWQQVETLNASANSWSPRNELAYLLRFGHFDAQVIVLLINTDDLFGVMPNSWQVGRDRNYPAQKPPLALVEVVQRYLLKPKPIPELEMIYQEGGDRVGANIEAIRQIKKVADAAEIPLLLAMTPLLRETGEPGPRDYELKARQRLQDFAAFEQILYLDFLPQFNTAADPSVLFRDNIHLSSMGNQWVSERISQTIQKMLNPKRGPVSEPSPADAMQEVFDDLWS